MSSRRKAVERPIARTQNGQDARAPWVLALLLAVYLALATAYNLATPVGASPDELGHAEYIRYLVANRRFPVLDKCWSYPHRWAYEAHQAPLYYLLAAPVWATVGAGTNEANLQDAPWRPQAYTWIQTGRNVAQGRAVRGLSTVIGAAGLVLLWVLVGVLYPNDGWLALVVTSLAAFLPMRLALAAAVSNDILLETLCTASLLAMALMIRKGYTDRRAFALGAAVGAAILTKTTAVLLLLPALITLLLVSRAAAPGGVGDKFDARLFLAGCLRTFGLAAGLAGPWLLRNRLLYGDFLAARAFADYFRQIDLSPAQMMAQNQWGPLDYLRRIGLPWTYSSFWGVFGAFNVWMAPAVYHTLIIPTALAPVGLLLRLRRWRRVDAPRSTIEVLLALWLVLVVVGYVRYNLLIVEPQSRFLFASLAPFALFTGIGWLAFVPHRARPMATLGVGIGMAALAVYAVAGVIFPFYHSGKT